MEKHLQSLSTLSENLSVTPPVFHTLTANAHLCVTIPVNKHVTLASVLVLIYFFLSRVYLLVLVIVVLIEADGQTGAF